MATTSLVGVSEREKGLLGRGMVAGKWAGCEGWWMCKVESQEAEIKMEVSLLYTMDLTPASWEERTLCSPVVRLILWDCRLGSSGLG